MAAKLRSTIPSVKHDRRVLPACFSGGGSRLSENASPRELASGLAEVIKYGIILDGAFFNWLEENLDALLRLDGPAMAYCIRRCCELKAEVVAADERETGLRALLNLGHTFGHAIEAEMGYGNWLHGEAVAAGMVMAARTSERLGSLVLPKRSVL